MLTNVQNSQQKAQLKQSLFMSLEHLLAVRNRFNMSRKKMVGHKTSDTKYYTKMHLDFKVKIAKIFCIVHLEILKLWKNNPSDFTRMPTFEISLVFTIIMFCEFKYISRL